MMAWLKLGDGMVAMDSCCRTSTSLLDVFIRHGGEVRTAGQKKVKPPESNHAIILKTYKNVG
jgi:hypothetical protein